MKNRKYMTLMDWYMYRDHDLDGGPEQEIKSEWESQGVVSVKCFTKNTRNDLIEPTNSYHGNANFIF